MEGFLALLKLILSFLVLSFVICIVFKNFKALKNVIWRRFFKGLEWCFGRTHAEQWAVFTSFFSFLTQTINLLGTERWLRIMFELGHKGHPIIHTSPEELLREMFLSWKEEHCFFFNYPSLRKGDKKLSIRHKGALSGCGERFQWKFCLQERKDLLFFTFTRMY